MSHNFYEGLVLTRPLPSTICDCLKPRFHRRPPWNRKLTDADAVEIRRRYRQGEAAAALATMYGISERNVYYVIDRSTYRDAEERAAA